MFPINSLNFWVLIWIMLMKGGNAGLSFHQPKLCPSATWDPNGISFLDNSTLDQYSTGFFVDVDNSIYVVEGRRHDIQMWRSGNQTSARTITTGLFAPYGLFVTSSGDIYTSGANVNVTVLKWSPNSTMGVTVMFIEGSCFDLFIDTNETLYCSITSLHRIVKRSLNSSGLIPTVAAGNGSIGLTPYTLFTPAGIFVSLQFDLYVADCGNNRIQLFPFGQLNATTLAGSGTVDTIALQCPTGIILDADGYIFVTEFNNHRVVRSGPHGYRCILGCTGMPGYASNQLNYPWTVRFDSDGNLFVNDRSNARIQKFLLATNSCDSSFNQPKLSACSTWNPYGITHANNNTIGLQPADVFVDLNNTVYIPAWTLDRIEIWLEGHVAPSRTISGNARMPYHIFVWLNDDIYLNSIHQDGQINRWRSNVTSRAITLDNNASCTDFFIDISESLYCSVSFAHRVYRTSLDNSSNGTTMVAGNGSAMLASNTLNSPYGIFVDSKFNLYVADCQNDRVQRFQLGSRQGITIAGNGAPGTTSLNCPVDITLDFDENLFIVDYINNRIVRSGPGGFQCIIGCTGVAGASSDQLNKPYGLSFDGHGNIYVADTYNNRVQKFLLSTRSCVQQPSQPFAPWTCPNPVNMGSNCNTSSSPCQMLNPCQNNGTCRETNSTARKYLCSCPFGFDGVDCQSNRLPCKPGTCLNNDVCNATSNNTFLCLCAPGFHGTYCETLINGCDGIVCLNQGVCRPSPLNYTCECLGKSYFGRLCEITADKIQLRQTISKSFAYIVIIALITLAICIITLDLLKYVFGIDPVSEDRRRLQKKQAMRKRRPPVAIRFIYVNAPTVSKDTGIHHGKNCSSVKLYRHQ